MPNVTIVGDALPFWYVEGGVHTDTSFSEVVPGTEEVYGPFYSYAEALAVWRGKMSWKIDICEHRLFIRHIS